MPPAPAAPESQPATLPVLGLDARGVLEAAGGTVIALIALYSSCDRITFLGRSLPLQQQWGVWLIAASLAFVVVVAEGCDDPADRERHLAGEERERAAEDRERAAEERNRASDAAERQRQATALLHRCALLSGRLQLDPSPTNSERFRALLALMVELPSVDGGS